MKYFIADCWQGIPGDRLPVAGIDTGRFLFLLFCHHFTPKQL